MLANATEQVLGGVLSTMVVVLVALGIAIARTREKVAKLEEWIRLHNDNRH